MSDNHGKILASWGFPEFAKHQRGFWWYAASLIISILLIIYAVMTANILFTLIIIMFIIVSLMHSVREQSLIRFSITEDGLEIGDKFFDYKELNKFWVAYDPPQVKKLFVEFKSGFRPHLTIELEDQNPVDIRKILLEYIEEDLDRENEPASEELGRWLKI